MGRTCSAVLLGASLLVPIAAHAEKKVEVITLKECAIRPGGSDATVKVRRTMSPRASCDGGVPASLTVIDTRFGVEFMVKGPVVSLTPRIFEPSREDEAAKLKSCIRVYVAEAYVTEWLVAADAACDGREPTSTVYRVYTRDDKVCIMPYKKCVEVGKLHERARARFKRVLDMAYTN